MAETGTSAASSEYAPSEMPPTEAAPAGFPPYPPYATEPVPPSVADTIIAGRDIRVQHKSMPKKSVRPPPKPARPRGPKATDVKMSKRAMRAHARCLRRHGAVLTDTMERLSKPPRRAIIYLWRDYAHTLPAEAIGRLRSMLDADEPFKPDQAYEYFINLRKTKKKTATTRGVNQIKKDMEAMCGDKRFMWARNATVAFAKGIQQRLARPGAYALADGMLRLSNIILEDLCGYMNIRTPSRRCTHPKAKFMMEMADKVAVWIDEILAESDDRMLMMDFDEDDDVIGAAEFGNTGFADDFLNMMGDGGGGGRGGGLLGLLEPKAVKENAHRNMGHAPPAYMKFTGEMLEAFMILTDSMTKKGNEQLISYGKFNQTYAEGADELKRTTDLDATDYSSTLANKLKNDLMDTAKPNTPSNIVPFMKEMVNICSNYLAQVAEYNKDKGPAFKLLVKSMRAKGKEQLYTKGKAQRTYAKAANELHEAKDLESNRDDPNLSQELHSKLSKLVENQTPPELKQDMSETLDISSKYLSQCAVDENERGPAFDILIKELEKHGADPFTPEYPHITTKFVAAYVLKSAPGFSGVTPDPKTAPVFAAALHKAVDVATPKELVNDMKEVIERCSNYLSAFVRDRDKALQTLLKMMKSKPKNELMKRDNQELNYGTGATEIEAAPVLMPFAPIKDVANEGRGHLTQDMASVTPTELQLSMKALIQDVSKYLSQPFALKSGIAGERYPLNLLAAVKKTLGTRQLFKYKAYGQTYSDAADVLKYAGPLESDPNAEDLRSQISAEMDRGIPTRLAPTITSDLRNTMTDASKHLAKMGKEKGEALQHLVNIMKEEGDAPLGEIQGYQQSYKDAARRLENAKSLAAEKVEKAIYESVKGKLTNLTEKKSAPEHSKVMPGVVDDSSKFLSSPMPESEAEKRQLLADLMARKEDEILHQEGLYKMTYTEGGEEIMDAPVGVVQSKDESTKQKILQKVNAVIPEKKLQDLLKEPANEGAAYLTDVIKGRGAAMQVIHDGLNKDKDKSFLSVGAYNKTQGQAAEMLEKAPHFGGQNPSVILVDKVAEAMKGVPMPNPSELAKPFLKETSDIAVNYIAGVATKECGSDVNKMDGLRKSASAPSIRKDADVVTGVTRSTSESAISGKERDAKLLQLSKDDEEERRRRAEAEAERRRRALEAQRRLRAAGGQDDFDPEREQATQILHQQLRARGAETFYKQPHAELNHTQASEWLSMKPPMKVDKSVKESGDTARLHKKFERKLSNLVSKVTPPDMYDVMQDVIIESARILSEYFVSKSYKALVKVALISEMQKRGNEILIEVDGAAETYFFAAQRLKKTDTLEVAEPCSQAAYHMIKKLEDMIRCRSMARKLTAAMKDHIKEAADYLSAYVTKPDEQIEAYVALLSEMEAAGDKLLVEGDIPKSYKDSVAYLRQLTSFKDEISQPNSSLQSTTEGTLKTLMSNAPESGYNKSVMNEVITDSTRLLVSYIMLQGLKTEALRILIEHMDRDGGNVLLRHGTIRKTYRDGADILRPKNADQLGVIGADPVVARKIEIKLRNLMAPCTPDKYQSLMDDVIEDATLYLAVNFLQPRTIQVCKCMKNVFVQCELWCDEILRRVTRPCCTCSRHISAQALADLAVPGQPLRISPGSSRAFAPGLEITLKPCPSKPNKFLDPNKNPLPCPAIKPTEGCQRNSTASYLLYSTVYNNQRYPYSNNQINLSSSTDSVIVQPSLTPSPEALSPTISDLQMKFQSFNKMLGRGVPSTVPEDQKQETDTSSPSFYTPQSANSNSTKQSDNKPFWQATTAMFAKVLQPSETTTQYLSNSSKPTDSTSPPRRIASVKRGFNSRAPIVTTDQMADWHAMLVSLMWNVQAWRGWIQENINRAVSYQPQLKRIIPEDESESWTSFQRRVSTEALQWRQYNNFSRRLTVRLALRYKDKKIVSPTRTTVKTDTYLECQKEMMDIIDMFNRWTKWLTVVLKETDLLPQRTDSLLPPYELRWKHFKTKVEDYLEDWNKYNSHLSISWEQKYRKIVADWIPASSWRESGPVWVVSACGAVPSGAVAAGIYDGEVTWLARTTHKCNVLPAALHPSKHCCLVYSDGAAYHYTKYQVMCNAEVSWVACRATEVGSVSGVGGMGARAVRVAQDVYVGRVHYRGSHLVGAVHAPAYRCHVVIFGRPFAFNCYELLVLAQNDG